MQNNCKREQILTTFSGNGGKSPRSFPDSGGALTFDLWQIKGQGGLDQRAVGATLHQPGPAPGFCLLKGGNVSPPTFVPETAHVTCTLACAACLCRRREGVRHTDQSPAKRKGWLGPAGQVPEHLTHCGITSGSADRLHPPPPSANAAPRLPGRQSASPWRCCGGSGRAAATG